ncbi:MULTISPECIES: bacteriocin [Bacillota]|uniref:bacteriocin n=1 Tax=Bacillota TaxID=1239 RepID=UPI00041FB9B4|nr:MULTISPECIES: bacteriocin [Bacillota]GMG59864.1 hypothetical protein AH4_32190 [Enterococcus gallinarum]
MLKEKKKIKNIENYKKLSNQNLQSITGGAKRSESIIVSICNWLGFCNNKDMRK